MTGKYIRTMIAALCALAMPGLSHGQEAPPSTHLAGPSSTFEAIAYAASDAGTGKGHLLDLYLPAGADHALPLVIFVHGSGWMADNGREGAQAVAAALNPHGYAVAGVAIRSSGQAQFPGQLHDIKAAIRWLRTNAGRYRINPGKIGIMGESSGGWTSAMAAVTGDAPEMEGALGVQGVSSAVQASVAFYPPTDFLKMDAWALAPCNPKAMGFEARFCHDGPQSPESRLIGCAIQTCPAKVASANPVRYITPADPPVLIIHGEHDALVPHNQGELFYQALNKACHDASFISLPIAPHGSWFDMLSTTSLNYGATERSTEAANCKVTPPHPVTFDWNYLIAFFDSHLK